MKTVFNPAGGYSRPLCQIVEASQEGVLCASEVKAYNSTLDEYTESTESYW